MLFYQKVYAVLIKQAHPNNRIFAKIFDCEKNIPVGATLIPWTTGAYFLYCTLHSGDAVFMEVH